MSEKSAGRILSRPEEAGVTRPSAEEIANARKLFGEFQEQIDRVLEADIPTEVSSKFSTTSRVPNTQAIPVTDHRQLPTQQKRFAEPWPKICRKNVLTPEEAGVTPPTEELALARKLFDEAQERINRLSEADHWPEVSPKFWDDTSGIEFTGWQDG